MAALFMLYICVLISRYLLFVESTAVWIFWDQGLKKALQDPFKAACYDSIVRAAQVANLPVIVGDKYFDKWLVDGVDIEFRIFRDLIKAKDLKLEAIPDEVKDMPILNSKQRKKKKSKEDLLTKYAFQNLAVLADLWRLAIIYKYGGIYVDFSTYIANPNFFKDVWDNKIKMTNFNGEINDWNRRNQFYGFKTYRADVAKGGDEPYEYSIWFLAAPPLSPFIGMWKSLSIGKMAVGRLTFFHGYEGVEDQIKYKYDPTSRFRSDYLGMGHHSAASIVKLLKEYPSFNSKVIIDYAACSHGRNHVDFVENDQIRSAEHRELKVMDAKKLHVCTQAGDQPNFYKFNGGGKQWRKHWAVVSNCPDDPDLSTNIQNCFLTYLHGLHNADQFTKDPRIYQTFHAFIDSKTTRRLRRLMAN